MLIDRGMGLWPGCEELQLDGTKAGLTEAASPAGGGVSPHISGLLNKSLLSLLSFTFLYFLTSLTCKNEGIRVN